jgi:hypothetical protein
MRTYRNKTRRNKKARKTRKRKSFRGGTTVPFSSLGNIVSDFTSSVSNLFSTFNVMPSAYNPPHTPDVSKQFLNPVDQSIQQIYKSAF